MANKQSLFFKISKACFSLLLEIRIQFTRQLKNGGFFGFCYNYFIDNKTLDKIIEDFVQKGGRINSYYITNPRRKPTLVFYKRWYRGRNIREAISRALAG